MYPSGLPRRFYPACFTDVSLNGAVDVDVKRSTPRQPLGGDLRWWIVRLAGSDAVTDERRHESGTPAVFGCGAARAYARARCICQWLQRQDRANGFKDKTVPMASKTRPCQWL